MNDTRRRWEFVVPFPLANKANTFEIRFDPRFWRLIANIAKSFQRPYWIGPSDEAKYCEQTIAWYALSKIGRDLTGPVSVTIKIAGRLDADAIKACLDGLERSGRIKNDSQVERLTITKLPGRNDSFEIEVEEIERTDEEKAKHESHT